MDKKILFGYVIASILLFLYSYTQVDLSLTLSRSSIYQVIEKGFQYIGFYQRPISAGLYVGLVILFFSLYFFSIRAAAKFTYKTFWTIILIMSGILVFSYPAFSYDMFNYLFTAKTVLVYHQNPYLVIPLQFNGIEPWLSFMHWTHLPSAYTPFWILLTLPVYLLGFGYLLISMWNVKLLVAAAYLVTIYLIGKILKLLEPDKALSGMMIFAFNPLVIFESLVSGHNDVVMMAFAMGSYVLYLTKKRWVSYFMLALSVASKLMTLVLLPIFILGWQRKWALWAMIVGLTAVVTQRSMLPWYMVWIIPFYALVPGLEWAFIAGSGLSLGLLLSYVPYLYTGGYNQPVPVIMNYLIYAPFAVSLLLIFIRKSQFARNLRLQV